MWRFIADLSAVINTERAEKEIKNVPHSAKSISIIDMMETRTILRTISEQLIQNLRTTSLGQNLLVPIKRAYIWSILIGVIFYCCCSYEYL